jgi:hypothetical protein
MKKLTPVLDDDAEHDVAPLLWRYIGKPLATIASVIVLTIVIIDGESWAIRQAPLLLSDSAMAVSPIAGCSPEEGAEDVPLPVAILH